MEITGHISATRMERFSIGALDHPEMNGVSVHLVDCRACHHLFVETLRRQLGDSSLSFSLAPEFWLRHEHLEYEQLVGLADKTVDATEREILETHLKTCSSCREDLSSFLAFQEQLEPQLSVRYGRVETNRVYRMGWKDRWFGFAWSPAYATAIVLIVFGLITAVLVIKRRSATLEAGGPRPSPVKPSISPTPTLGSEVVKNTSPTPAPVPTEQLPIRVPSPAFAVKNKPSMAPAENRGVIAEVNDERGAIAVDRNGNVLGADDLSQEAKRDISEVLVTQKLKTPQSNEDLAGAPITLRGPDNTPTFRLLSPGREVVLSDHPSFAWGKLAGATSYRVVIGDLKGHEIASSGQISGDQTMWTMPTALKRGEIYTWEVEANVDGKKVFAPGTSQTQMKFMVLSDRGAKELEELKKANSHLALGVFYAREGMVTDAELEFQILIQANPKSSVLKKLLKQVQSWKSSSAD